MTPKRDYDDADELVRYIWNHYASLATPLERRVNSAGGKQAVGYPADAVADILKLVNLSEAEFQAELADGFEAFRKRTATRLLKESADVIFINRCPRCNRILRTPKALQCEWCGHDWHAR